MLRAYMLVLNSITIIANLNAVPSEQLLPLHLMRCLDANNELHLNLKLKYTSIPALYNYCLCTMCA